MLSDEQLREWERLCAEASDPPWQHVYVAGCHDVVTGPADDPTEQFSITERDRPEDWDFVAAARTGWPAAIAEIRRLRAELAALRAEEGR